MNKTWLVFWNELWNTVVRRSFLIMLFLIPLLSLFMMLFVSYFGESSGEVVGQIFSTQQDPKPDGIVDLSGLLKVMPPEVSQDTYLSYPSQEEARRALEANQIEGYYLVSEDYLRSGDVTYVRADYNPFAGLTRSDRFTYILDYNLLEQDKELIYRVQQPVRLEVVSISPEPQREQENMLTFFLPYGVTMLFYITIIGAASLMLNSLTNEKQNRVIEILMTSVTPLQMLAGKITALGVAGLLQTLVWSGAGLILLRVSGRELSLPVAFQVPTSILAWGALFFLLGYGLYASLMAGVGALVPNLREATQATWILVLPLIVPVMVLSNLVDQPNGGLAVFLSLFPFTAPVSMMTRLSAGSVPLWQILLSAAILSITGALVLKAVAGLFRAQTLLSGQTFSAKRFILALVGKD